MVILLMDEERVKRAVSAAELSFEDCWAKLALLQSRGNSVNPIRDAFISFQPTLLSALVDLETFYNELCKFQRELVSKKASLKAEMFSREMQKLTHYKDVLNEIIDVGKTLGDAFAWIFYQFNRPLLRKHFEHEFIPRLPTRHGGIGEINFIRQLPVFGRYLVLSHSITTYLREGDVSLIDPNTLEVAAIGELKTHRHPDAGLTVSIFFGKGQKLSEHMLPKPQMPTATSNAPVKLDPQIVGRLQKQIQRIEKIFEPRHSDRQPDKLCMHLGYPKLEELFTQSTSESCAIVRADRGLSLVGKTMKDSSFVSRVTKQAVVRDTNHAQQMEEVLQAAKAIVDKSLPDNGIVIGSMLYHAKRRYELAMGMRPLFWWPLSLEARKAITFQRMLVMTLFNPAFLIHDLRDMGLNVEFKKSGAIIISKQYGEGTLTLAGMHYLQELIQTHLFSEKTVVALIQNAIEGMEKANIKHSAYVDLNFDFVFQ